MINEKTLQGRNITNQNKELHITTVLIHRKIVNNFHRLLVSIRENKGDPGVLVTTAVSKMMNILIMMGQTIILLS